MTLLLFRLVLIIVLLLAPVADLLTAQTAAKTDAAGIKFRAISYMFDLTQPIGITEAKPGIFYSTSGQPATVFTVTTSGNKKLV
jgi:hypothetical protein